MADDPGVAHHTPSWFVPPGEGDFLAWVAFGFLCLAIYGIVTLYAAFDRWAEHQSKGTPLAKTIPTLLLLALLYELFPIDHFSVLLPLSAILLALMADWSRFHAISVPEIHPDHVSEVADPPDEPAPDPASPTSESSEDVRDV